MDDTVGWQPDHDWTPEQWVFETRSARDALAALGVSVPRCLPGEPEDCGTPTWAHYGSYLAMLKARAQVMIEANLARPTPGGVTHFGHQIYQDVLVDYRREVGIDPTIG